MELLLNRCSRFTYPRQRIWNYAPMYLSSTSSTHGHLWPYLRPGTWVLANGSKMICQPLGHLLGPGSSHTGLGIWVFPMSDLIFMCLVLLEPGPKTQIVGIRQTYMLQCFECISLILNITHFGRMKPTIGHAFSIILFWHQMRESVFHTTNSSKNTGNFDLNKFTVL